jgi:hypothetical protein
MTDASKAPAKPRAPRNTAKPAAEKEPVTLSTEQIEEAQAKAATKTHSGAEAEGLPAPTASSTVQADKEQKVAEAVVRQGSKGDFGPFQDTAPAVGAALSAAQGAIDTGIDFDDEHVPLTIVEGDVTVAVKVINQRNVVDVAPTGWSGGGQIFAPYQVKHLIKALQQVEKNTRKTS